LLSTGGSNLRNRGVRYSGIYTFVAKTNKYPIRDKFNTDIRNVFLKLISVLLPLIAARLKKKMQKDNSPATAKSKILNTGVLKGVL
jgi:hypothetical protein